MSKVKLDCILFHPGLL